MLLTNKRRLPDAIVRAVANDTYTKGNADVSVTELLGPPQIRRLYLEHEHEIEEDVSDRVWSLLGQAVHSIIERASDDVDTMTETTVYTEFNGKKIKGTTDNLTISLSEMCDFKVTNVRKIKDSKPPFDWVAQTNTYRWMLFREHGVIVNSIAVIAIFRDWTKHEAARAEDYPQAPSIRIEIPLWSVEETEAFVAERLRLHFAEDIAPCTEADIWAKPTKYAVMKPNRQTAVKLFDNEEEAKLYTHDPANKPKDKSHLYVVTRPGEAVRCAGYCPVSRWCPQWAADPRRTQSTDIASTLFKD